jgi:hypothetical protein
MFHRVLGLSDCTDGRVDAEEQALQRYWVQYDRCQQDRSRRKSDSCRSYLYQPVPLNWRNCSTKTLILPCTPWHRRRHRPSSATPSSSSSPPRPWHRRLRPRCRSRRRACRRCRGCCRAWTSSSTGRTRSRRRAASRCELQWRSSRAV